MRRSDGVKPAASVKFTYEDFLHFPDDGKRHEIIDGEHYVTPSPNTIHQTVSMNLTGALLLYLKQHPRGQRLSMGRVGFRLRTSVRRPEMAGSAPCRPQGVARLGQTGGLRPGTTRAPGR